MKRNPQCATMIDAVTDEVSAISFVKWMSGSVKSTHSTHIYDPFFQVCSCRRNLGVARVEIEVEDPVGERPGILDSELLFTGQPLLLTSTLSILLGLRTRRTVASDRARCEVQATWSAIMALPGGGEAFSPDSVCACRWYMRYQSPVPSSQYTSFGRQVD